MFDNRGLVTLTLKCAKALGTTTMRALDGPWVGDQRTTKVFVPKGFIGTTLPYYELQTTKSSYLVSNVMELMAMGILTNEADHLYEACNALFA